MIWISWGVGFVFVSNLLFLGLAVWLARGLLGVARQGRNEISRAARKLATGTDSILLAAAQANQAIGQLVAELAKLPAARAGAAPAMRPVASAQGTTEEAADDATQAALAALLASVEAEKARLNRRLDQVQDHLRRTLTEKEFIEDRFLMLDQQQQVPAPATAAIAATEAATEAATADVAATAD
jgi:hypothetical protein